MAPETGSQADFLNEALASEPHRFDFFQLVRRLECAHPELPPIGRSQRAAEDPVRFGQDPSLWFAPSALGGYEPARDGEAARLYVNFMGLLGPNGPLPLHLTEYIQQRIVQHGDPTLARFLDVFNHRMICMFYRAWAQAQPAVSHDRGGLDFFAVYVGSLFGLGMETLRDRDAVPDLAKLHYSGRLIEHSRHPEGLASILRDYFGVPVRIVEFIGQWLEIPPDSICHLGRSPQTGCLGRTLVIGSRVWDCQQKFRIRLGPMGLRAYERLLPGDEGFRRLLAWVRLYLTEELGWEAQLVLRRDEVPEIQLGVAGRLGWTTWVKSRPLDRDADDLVLEPIHSAARAA